MSSGGNGAPPDDTSVSDERSNESKSGCSSMRQNCVGTPDHADTRCSAVSCRCVPGSHRPGGGKTSDAAEPGTGHEQRRGARDVEERGGADRRRGRCVGGGGAIPFSSMVTARPNAIAEPMCTMLRWVRVAPFGRPVVPDVNRIMNGSSSSMATSGRSAPVSARRHLLDEGREGDHGDVAVGDADLGEPVEPGLVAEEHLGRGELHAVRELGTGPPAVEPDDDARRGDRRPLGQRVRRGCWRSRTRPGRPCRRRTRRRAPPRSRRPARAPRRT